MELVRDYLEVEASGPLLGSFQLGIEPENYSLAMELLIDLYTDPPGSVMREIASNAYDANKVAGNGDIPIEITLPTRLAPTLVIKDRGRGMDREFLMTTYCNLLSSTKRGANEEIGGYGIGSKSPLGYTDSYTLSTRVNGEELHVHVSRNGGFHLLGSNPTQEGDGTTVIVQVRSDDCLAFERATSWLRYMDPPPLINGVPMPREEVLLQGEGWSITKRASMADGTSPPLRSDVQVLLGPIPYKLDLSKVRGNLGSEADHVISTPGVCLHFPIGTLSLTPSRETLRYDEGTITTLIDTINRVYPLMVGAIGDLLDSQEWVVDAVALSREYGFHYWDITSKRPGRNYTYSSVTFPPSETWISYTYSSWLKDHITRRVINSYQFSSEVEVYIGDKDVVRRARTYIRAEKNPSLTVIVGPSESVVEENGILKPLPITNLPSYDDEDEEGEDTKEPTPKKVLPQLSKGHMRARKWNPNASNNSTLLYTYTEDTTIPLGGEGCYLVMLKGKVIHPLLGDTMLSYGDISALLEGIYHSGQGDLYVVLPDQVHRLGPGWSEAIGVFLERMSPYIPWMKQVANVGYRNPYTSVVLSSTGYAGTDLEDTYFCELLKLTEELRRLYSGVFSRLYNLYHYTFCSLWETVPTSEHDPILNLRDLVEAVYPHLTRGGMPYDMVGEYVRKVEADLKREWGLYSACKLTKGAPTAIMNGRELMIHHYGGAYNVAGYYQQFE